MESRRRPRIFPVATGARGWRSIADRLRRCSARCCRPLVGPVTVFVEVSPGGLFGVALDVAGGPEAKQEIEHEDGQARAHGHGAALQRGLAWRGPSVGTPRHPLSKALLSACSGTRLHQGRRRIAGSQGCGGPGGTSAPRPSSRPWPTNPVSRLTRISERAATNVARAMVTAQHHRGPRQRPAAGPRRCRHPRERGYG
jgi:hypothetical protein